MRSSASLLLPPLLLAAACAGTPAREDGRLAASREWVARFQSELGARLSAALAAGGPVEAISVCHLEAPAIAAKLARESGATIGRRSQRFRNPANAPSADEAAVLDEFAAHLARDPATVPERFTVASDGSARYMKAILVQPQCLACHGGALAPPVQAALAGQYPGDRATGYAAGDLRGAFVVEWPRR